MGLLSYDPMEDGDVASGNLWNVRLSAIHDLLNGNIDAANLANNAVTTAKIADNAVTYEKLVDEIFSDLVQTDTNTGTAGGTMNYVSLGGLKICWGNASTVRGGVNPTTYTVIFPSGFFNATPVFTATIGPNVDTNNQTLNIGGGALSASQAGINVRADMTTGNERVQWFAIGQ